MLFIGLLIVPVFIPGDICCRFCICVVILLVFASPNCESLLSIILALELESFENEGGTFPYFGESYLLIVAIMLE